jgi:thiol-disulfide isomerase/thioredoxin
VRLSDYRGKVVVLNFWATWCAPCAAEIPMLVQAEKYYNPKGVVFIAASVDDRKSKKSVPNFVDRYNVGFPVWLDATTRDLLRLGMGAEVPSTAFLDQEGRIVARVEGQMREGDLRERLDWLLGDRIRPAPPAALRRP